MGRIAERLRELRESGRAPNGRRPSQQAVADAMGRPKMSYVYYETNYKEEWLPQGTAIEIADALARFGVARESVLALAKMDDAPTPAAPSVRLFQTVLGVIFDHERGAIVPEDVLQDYAIALRDVCSAVASGELVETDDHGVRLKVRATLAVLQMKAQASTAP